LETNVEWAQHSGFEQLDLDAGVNTPLLPSASILTQWDDNWTLGLSASYELNDEWVLRSGYQWLESPVPSTTMLPTTAEQDQGVLAVGVGYSSGKHQLDFSYAIGLFSGRTISDNINPAFNGDYDFEAHLVSINYGYHF
jgi:long-chain fatty acid transport protein